MPTIPGEFEDVGYGVGMSCQVGMVKEMLSPRRYDNLEQVGGC